MARNFLIVDESPNFRRTLRSMILAHYDDVFVSEAASLKELNTFFSSQPYHIVFFSWRVSGINWVDFFSMAKKENISHFVLLTPNDQKSYVREAERLGVTERLLVPSHDNDVREIIDRLSEPAALRVSKRYNIPDTTILLEQSSGKTRGTVINISLGGMLCEINYASWYNWAEPAVVTLEFGAGEEQKRLGNIQTVLVRIHVIQSLADYTPEKLRVAYRFVDIGESVLAKLAEIFTQADPFQDMEVGDTTTL